MVKIVPSLASADMLRLGAQIGELGDYPLLHLDIEDGNFVPNITFGMKTVRSVADLWGKSGERTLDAHLMVTNPETYIDGLLEAGVSRIAFHFENVPYPAVLLNRIREGGAAAGAALNCMGRLEQVLPYAEAVDYLLIMTSEPDGKGQMFNARMLEKIKTARRLLPPSVGIMADGGISERELLLTADAGADAVVMGRAVWNYPDVRSRLEELMRMANGKGDEA